MKFAFGDGVTDTEVVVLFTRINTGLIRGYLHPFPVAWLIKSM